MSEIKAPDYSEPLIGWRCWWIKIDRETGAPYLSSLTALRSDEHGNYWPMRQALVARCLRYIGAPPDAPCSESPAWGCSCGVYAYDSCNDEVTAIARSISRNGVDRGPAPGTQVFGQVALWGKVIRHQRGYRSQFAYPLTLGLKAPLHPSIDRHRLFESLLDGYGCKVDERSWPIQLSWDL